MKNFNFYKMTILINSKLLIIFTSIVIYKYVDWFRANQEARLKLFVIISIILWLLKYLKSKKIYH